MARTRTRGWATRIVFPTAVGLGAAVALGWLGLQVQPASFPPYPGPATPPETAALAAELPAPVARHFRAVAGERIPRLESAVITGRARLRLSGLTFPSRLRFVRTAGRGYRHYIESTWFGLPLLRVNEWYLEGHARLELPFGVVANEPKVDMAANLAFWGEQLAWLPTVLATDPRVRWEAIDDTTARLIVPFGEAEDSFTVAFDPETDLLRWAEALRYRDATDTEKIPWRFEPLGWQTFHGLRLPASAAVTWQDQGTPWLVMTVEDVAYNVDVAEYVRSSGP